MNIKVKCGILAGLSLGNKPVSKLYKIIYAFVAESDLFAVGALA